MPDHPKPHRLIVRSYQVGFGDCFLLSFEYERIERHVLIDFGTTARAPGAGDDHMVEVAEAIAEATHGKLHAVVATHRHRDHISGFAGRSGEVIAELDPNVVLQPWTEHPDAEVDAREAPRVEKRSLTFLHTLANMDLVADRARRAADRFADDAPELAERLGFLGEDNVKNRAAVEALMELGKGRRRHRYLKEGNSAGLTSLLPGVRVHVLGPPSLEQTEEIRHQVHDNEEEFWQMQARASEIGLDPERRLFPDAPTSRDPVYARRFTERMKSLHLEQILELVLELDHALNNTSLILLFETQGKKLLFPGDAQWENWQHALVTKKEEYEALLQDVDLYKVGHHGSRNATPRSLWRLFDKRSEQEAGEERMKSLMSTLAGKHGSPENATEVPRRTLVEALDSETDLLTTQDLAPGELCHRVEYVFEQP